MQPKRSKRWEDDALYLHSVSRIILYDEPAVPEIDLNGLALFIQNMTGILTQTRPSVLKHVGYRTAASIASSRITNLVMPYTAHKPTPEEVELEMAGTADASNDSDIVCYDGIRLQNILCDLVPKNELALDTFHVIFTNKLCCTYDCSDCRYHGRALVCSNPSIISTTGIVEAPAKPRRYYTELVTMSKMGVDTGTLAEKYAKTCIQYHDKRLSGIVRGYFLQAFLYHVSGEAFCGDRDCQMFNAHWQSDLIHSQLESAALCTKHQALLESVRRST